MLLLTPSLSLWRFPEYVFLMTKELHLDPLVGYHAIELLQRYQGAEYLPFHDAPQLHICSAEAWCECVFSCQVHAQASYGSVNHGHTWGCGRLSSMESGGGSRWRAPGEIPSRGVLLPPAFKQTVSAQSRRFCDANIHHCLQPALRNYRRIVLKILSR